MTQMPRPIFPGTPSVLIFDVNETLIDFESMNPLFERLFGDKRVLREWLGQLVMHSMDITLAGYYQNYWDLGVGVLKMVADIHEKSISPNDIESLMRGMKTMPAHPDVEIGLHMLKDAGFRLVTLTNSPPTHGSMSPLENAGVAKYFDRQFNIETARAYKPAPVVYHMVAQELQVEEAECCMVAAHMWDLIGAQGVGMAGGFLMRPGNAVLPIPGLPQPHAVGKDLPELAGQLISLWRRT